MGDDTRIKSNRERTKKKYATLGARLSHYYGKLAKTYTLKGDQNHKDGMNFENRKCTNKICMIIFLVALVSKFYIFTRGYMYGDINMLMCGVDGAGN